MSADSLLTNWSSPGSSLVWPRSAWSLFPDAGVVALIARFCWFALGSSIRLALSAKACCFLTCGFLRTAFFTTGLMLFALVASKSLLLFFKTALFSCGWGVLGGCPPALWQIFVAEDAPVASAPLTPRQIGTLSLFFYTDFSFLLVIPAPFPQWENQFPCTVSTHVRWIYRNDSTI